MELKKLPPIEKIPEAYSAIVDERIQVEDSVAYVYSSNKEKRYTVLFDKDSYASNDSATYWQGYPGYPILAVWMKQGILSYHASIAKLFQGVDWNALNKKYKRKYSEALASLYAKMSKEEVEAVQQEITKVYEEIQQLSFHIKKNTKKVEKLER